MTKVLQNYGRWTTGLAFIRRTCLTVESPQGRFNCDVHQLGSENLTLSHWRNWMQQLLISLIITFYLKMCFEK